MKNNIFVIDTNTLISAFLFKYGNPRKALNKSIEIGDISASQKTYKELCEVLLRPKFDKYITLEKKLSALKEFKELAIFTEPLGTITDCRDPKDNKFLELAVFVDAACIVSGDKDLLVLHPFRGIPILNAADFISKFKP